MIYGFSSEGDTNANVDRAVATGVRLVRAFDLDTSLSVTTIENMVLYAASKGVKLLLLYHGNSPDMPLGNLLAHIQRVGPAGTLWSGGNAQYAAYAPTHIECGNEWSFTYRSGWTDQATNARGVADTVQRFYNAVGPTLGANAMKFICEGEAAQKGTTVFLDALIARVPSIRSMLDGWVVHPYGPVVAEEGDSYYSSLGQMVNALNSRGYTTDKIWITEDGLATNGGSTMIQGGSPNNYGFKTNCTFDEAATRILSLVRHMGTGLSYSNRIYCFLQYQAFDQWPIGQGTERERYFGLWQNNKSPKGALTSAAIQLATEFPYGGTTPPPPPDPVDPPASGFVINGQTMQWAAVPGATGYKTYERDIALYTNHGTGVLSYSPAARPPGTSISVGWTYVDSIGDHWVAEQIMTWPASGTALVGSASMTFSTQGAVGEAAAQSAEITDVVYRMVSVAKAYVTPTPFQVSTGRELLWDPVLSKFFYMTSSPPGTVLDLAPASAYADPIGVDLSVSGDAALDLAPASSYAAPPGVNPLLPAASTYEPANGVAYSAVSPGGYGAQADTLLASFFVASGQSSVAIYGAFTSHELNSNGWILAELDRLAPVGVTAGMLAWWLSTPTYSPGTPGGSSAQVANGAVDTYLLARAAEFSAYNKPLFVRPNWEMNGYWMPWCAYDSGGNPRSGNSHAEYRNMWRRTVILSRGGTRAAINAQLTALGMPGLTSPDTGAVPATTNVAWVWMPNYGNNPGVDDALAYYPGDAYVDWVGVDWYAYLTQTVASQSGLPNSIYDSFSGPGSTGQKPFMLAEWNVHDGDKPTYATDIFNWMEARAKVKAAVYFNFPAAQGWLPLEDTPNTRAVYQTRISAARWLKTF